MKSNLFNLYEYNTYFILIKLETEPNTNNTINNNHHHHNHNTSMISHASSSASNSQKKYVKFTCFLSVKNDSNSGINSIYRVKDSTFYFDFTNSQASGSGLP